MAALGWYFQYGGYRHGNAECSYNEERRTVFSHEKVPIYDSVRWDIHGLLMRDNAAALKAAEIAMMDAYRLDGQDAGFYAVGDAATAHVVTSASTIRGVRVARRPFFPDSKGAEGVLWRNYGITLEWEEPLNQGQVLLSCERSVRVIGNGGANWDIVPGVKGEPVVMPKTQGSKVTIVQSGRSVGRDYYPLPDTPLWMREPPLHGPSMMAERYVVPGPSLERVTVWSYTFFFSRKTVAPNPRATDFRL